MSLDLGGLILKYSNEIKTLVVQEEEQVRAQEYATMHAVLDNATQYHSKVTQALEPLSHLETQIEALVQEIQQARGQHHRSATLLWDQQNNLLPMVKRRLEAAQSAVEIERTQVELLKERLESLRAQAESSPSTVQESSDTNQTDTSGPIDTANTTIDPSLLSLKKS
ncbi:hypothetical protein FRB99_002766 [Tulasnella sp. 403]|nr:hypothetical protein FRB99_002766 [Tulasnella sp. 403]